MKYTIQISNPRVCFWDADFKEPLWQIVVPSTRISGPQRGSLIWTVPLMQNKGEWRKNRGDHLLGRSFRAGQLFGHGYASGHGSLIKGGGFYLGIKHQW